jgi:hypothetical protein
MIPAPPQPKYAPGTRLRIIQYVRVGHRRWQTQVEGVVVIEMGGKASYCQQETLGLRRDDGELTEVAIDQNTQIENLTATVA